MPSVIKPKTQAYASYHHVSTHTLIKSISKSERNELINGYSTSVCYTTAMNPSKNKIKLRFKEI